MAMTTTKKGFRTEDITFHGARMQSEVAKEIEQEEEVEVEVKAPVSLTPEQVIEFYKAKIAHTKDSNEKRVYSTTIKWIAELQTTKKDLLALREKEIARLAQEEEPEDIE